MDIKFSILKNTPPLYWLKTLDILLSIFAVSRKPHTYGTRQYAEQPPYICFLKLVCDAIKSMVRSIQRKNVDKFAYLQIRLLWIIVAYLNEGMMPEYMANTAEYHTSLLHQTLKVFLCGGLFNL